MFRKNSKTFDANFGKVRKGDEEWHGGRGKKKEEEGKGVVKREGDEKG